MCQGHPIPFNATPVSSLGCDSRGSACAHSRRVSEGAIHLNKNTLMCFDAAQPPPENRSLLRGAGGGGGGGGGRVCGWFANQVAETTVSQTVSEGWGGQLNKTKRTEEKRERGRLIKNEIDTKRKQTERLGAGRRGTGKLGDNIKKSHAFVISQFPVFVAFFFLSQKNPHEYGRVCRRDCSFT